MHEVSDALKYELLESELLLVYFWKSLVNLHDVRTNKSCQA